jgi:hypothetical protein
MTLGGSLIGTKDGMGLGAGTSGLAVAGIMLFDGSPDSKLTGNVGSDICLDVKNNELYMCEAAAGSEWIRLVSGT